MRTCDPLRLLALPFALALAVSLPAQASGDSISDAVSGLMKKAQVGGNLHRVWSEVRAGRADKVPDLVRLAQEGNPDAQLFVGYLLDNGVLVKKDSETAAKYFKAGSEKSGLAQYNLGLLQLLGRGVRQDKNAALKNFEESVKKDPAIEQAHVRMAQLYLERKQFQDAKRAGDACANMGNTFCFSVLARVAFVEKDYRSSMHWARKAENACIASVAPIISHIYANGLTTERSQLMAAAWDFIHQGSRTASKSIPVSGSSVYANGLDEKETQKAKSFSADWLRNCENRKDAIPYRATIHENRTWRMGSSPL